MVECSELHATRFFLIARRRSIEVSVGYQFEKKEIPDDVSWIHSLTYSPGDQISIWSLSSQWDIERV
jgi:hypothetical protein